jgi:hypothetical protein
MQLRSTMAYRVRLLQFVRLVPQYVAVTVAQRLRQLTKVCRRDKRGHSSKKQRWRAYRHCVSSVMSQRRGARLTSS